MPTTLSPRRSLLFTPANRPELFAKALQSGADMVCVDLEDSVAPDQKGSARADAFKFLRENGSPERILRINGPDTAAGQDDLKALLESGLAEGIILVPKVDSASTLQRIARQMEQAMLPLGIAALIESVAGVENIFAIVKGVPQVSFVMFGGADLAAELGTPVAPEPLAYGRSRLVYAARQANLNVFDMPCLHFRDLNTVRRDADYARLLGFTGKAAIHPANLEPIHTAFTPTPAEIDEARRVIEAFRTNTTGVTSLDGRLVEKPVVRAMEVVLARAHAAGLTS